MLLVGIGARWRLWAARKAGSHFGRHLYRELVHHAAPSCTRRPAPSLMIGAKLFIR